MHKKVSEMNENEKIVNLKTSTSNTIKTAAEKVKNINESESIQNVKRRSSASWDKACVATSTAVHKSGEFAKKTKEEVLVPTWEKTKVATTAAVKKSTETAKPILAKTVEATKEGASKVSEKSSNIYQNDIKPAANKAGQTISTTARRASISAQTIFKS